MFVKSRESGVAYRLIIVAKRGFFIHAGNSWKDLFKSNFRQHAHLVFKYKGSLAEEAGVEPTKPVLNRLHRV